MKRWGALLAGPALAVGAVAATLFVGGAGGAAPAAASSNCLPPLSSPASRSTPATSLGASTHPKNGTLPTQVGAWKGDQVVNAALIVKAGQDLRLEPFDLTVGVMTAMGETSLLNVNHGDAVGPDSRGLFQQRANGAWGTYQDRMNPTTAATNFFKALIQVPGRTDLPPTIAAHQVQANSDAGYYAPFWADAKTMVATLTSDPALLTSLPASGAPGPCLPAPAVPGSRSPAGAVTSDAGEKSSPVYPRMIHDTQMTAALNTLAGMGYTVRENPHFGGVTPGVHMSVAAGGWHYLGGAADITWPGPNPNAHLNQAVCVLEAQGVKGILWQVPNHYTHVHADVGKFTQLGTPVPC